MKKTRNMLAAAVIGAAFFVLAGCGAGGGDRPEPVPELCAPVRAGAGPEKLAEQSKALNEEPDRPPSSYTGAESGNEEGGCFFMRIMVVKFPKALCGLLRRILHMDG